MASFPEVAAVLTVGDELLEGRTRDANLMSISRALAARGVVVEEARTVADRLDSISSAVRELAGEGRLLVTTGGLGPTEDDMTLQGVAQALGIPLRHDERAEEMVRSRMSGRRGAFPRSALKQAVIPRGGIPVLNRVGVAPGVVMESGGGAVVCLPGVPSEVLGLLEDCLDALGITGSESKRYALVRTWGVRENDLFDGLTPRANKLGCRLAYLPGACRVDIKVFGEKRRAMVEWIESRYSRHIYALTPESLPQALARRLCRLGLSTAVAESCTGGMLGAELTSVPGASEWFFGGVISYSNEAKRDLLDVSEEVLLKEGAVSRQAVAAMARGAMRRLSADTAMAVSGVAGPTGGSAEKPVGTVWLAVAGPGGVEEQRVELFGGDREHVRRSSVTCAMGMLLELLSEEEG